MKKKTDEETLRVFNTGIVCSKLAYYYDNYLPNLRDKKSPQDSRFTMTLMGVLLCCIVSRFLTHSNTGCFYTNLEYDYIWLQLFCLAKF